MLLFRFPTAVAIPHALRMIRVDLAGWKEDDEFSPYPEGSRDKYALIAPQNAGGAIVPGHRYLMKFSNPRYPIQFWSEIIADMFGRLVGVPVPPCHYAEDSQTGTPGSLIAWFYGACVENEDQSIDAPEATAQHDDLVIPIDAPPTHSVYVPGSSYMIRRIEDYDLKTGRQHNLKHIAHLLTRFRQLWHVDYWGDWAKMLTFDTLIGNTDRHQDNWGVLWRANPAGGMVPRFAPAFDNGTSLLHEITEPNLVKFRSPKAVESYVRRGRHHLRWNMDDAKQIGHLELIEGLIKQRPTLRDVISVVADYDEEDWRETLFSLTIEPSPHPISEERCDAIMQIMSHRRARILETVRANND